MKQMWSYFENCWILLFYFTYQYYHDKIQPTIFLNLKRTTFKEQVILITGLTRSWRQSSPLWTLAWPKTSTRQSCRPRWNSTLPWRRWESFARPRTPESRWSLKFSTSSLASSPAPYLEPSKSAGKQAFACCDLTRFSVDDKNVFFSAPPTLKK